MPAPASAYRDFPGRRWLGVLLRAAHLAGVVGVGAGLLVGEAAAAGFVYLMVLSGVAMALLDGLVAAALAAGAGRPVAARQVCAARLVRRR